MKILLATDGSRYALAAARAVSQWMPSLDGSVDVLAVIPKVHTSFNSAVQALRSYSTRGLGAASGHKRMHAGEPAVRPAAAEWHGAAGRWVEEAAQLLRSRGFRVRELVRTGNPAEVAVKRAGAEPYDLVVVGAKGRGDTPFLDIGSVALATIEHVGRPVLMVRARLKGHRVPTRLKPLRLLLAVDGSPESARAAEWCARLFAAPTSRAQVLVVAERANGVGLDARTARDLAHSTARHLTASGLLADPLVDQGDAAERIGEHAHGADLIVMGSRSVLKMEERHMGSVSLEVARSAPASVLVVRNTTPVALAEPALPKSEPVGPRLEVAYRGIAGTAAVEARAQRAAAALRKVAPDLMRAHMTIGRADGRHRTGTVYDVRLELALPGRRIAVSRTPPRHKQDETLLSAIDDVCAKAKRALVEKRRKANDRRVSA